MLLVDCIGSTDLPLLCLESSNGDGLKLTIISIITQLQQDHEDSFSSADVVAVGFDGGQFEKTSATSFRIKSLVEQNPSPSSDRASWGDVGNKYLYVYYNTGWKLKLKVEKGLDELCVQFKAAIEACATWLDLWPKKVS